MAVRPVAAHPGPDGRRAAESAGESIGRWTFRELGMPAPVLQHEVWAAADDLVGTSDWAWPGHGLLGEFDGKITYGRLLRPGRDPGDVVLAEEQREDRMPEVSGHAMIRFVWHDWSRPRVTAERFTCTPW